MYARVTTFECSPEELGQAIEVVRSRVDGPPPAGLEDTRMLMLVDPTTGRGLGITLYRSEEARRRGDETLRAMPRAVGNRTSVGFYDVPVHLLT